MAKRKTPSLALSEYVATDADSSTELWRARLEMIEAVKRIYPKFLETLLAEVFPLYRQLAKEGNAQVGRHPRTFRNCRNRRCFRVPLPGTGGAAYRHESGVCPCWRLMKQGPKYLKIGAMVRYKPGDISAWLPGPSNTMKRAIYRVVEGNSR
jgi:hypothetical protein